MVFSRVLILLFATGFSVAHAAPASKLACSPRELKTQDCHLNSGHYDLRLLKTTLAWNDGTWHTVDPLPLAGEGIEWEKVQFAILNDRPILQLWFWDKGVGETHVQSLHWFTADAEKRALTLLAEGVVRKRTPRAGKSALYDRAEPHGIRAIKGAIEWRIGDKSKRL